MTNLAKIEHSPEPWEAIIGGGGCIVAINSTVLPPIVVPIPANYLLEFPERVLEAQANARLAAQAPKLLRQRDRLREALARVTDRLSFRKLNAADQAAFDQARVILAETEEAK